MTKTKVHEEKDLFTQILESLDRIALDQGMTLQENGIVEPAEESDHRYHLQARSLYEGPYAPYINRSRELYLSIAAKTPEDAIRKWVESRVFPRRAYEVNAFKSPQAYRRGDKPLATLRGDR